MIWRRLYLTIAAGTTALLLGLAWLTYSIIERTERSVIVAAQTSLERAAQAIEITLDRQLLQVQAALASLPTLFSAADIAPVDAAKASRLLQGLNFQALVFRDLLLVRDDGTILAAARSRTARRTVPIDAATFNDGPNALIGPVSNSLTGEWSLYITRSVPDWIGIVPVAEVPIAALMTRLAETGIATGTRLFLERASGELVAALPHDELNMGRPSPSALAGRPPDGKAFLVSGTDGRQELAVIRASLYGDVRVALTADYEYLLAGWQRDRERTIFAAWVGGLLIASFGAALITALRQRARVDTERERAATVLASAIEAMSDGFVMWDAEDRLVICNEPYRDTFGRSAGKLSVGAHYEEVIRTSAEAGEFPQAVGRIDAFVAESVSWHRAASDSIERRLADGRWLLMRERRMADGGTVGIRTDITALKATLAELADANARANAAAEEAQRQNAALIERESRIRFLAHHDDLTRLPNRVQFRDRIAATLDSAAERGEQAALLYLDLDRFKDVNDTLGHPVGDALLQAVASRLSATIDPSDRVARLGGDEFAVISLAARQPEQAQILSARIVEELSRPYTVLGHTIAISVSVGIAVADGNAADADSLLKQADLALYQAKAQGRGTVTVFAPEMDAHLRDRLEMEADLRQALAQQQLVLAYQPVCSLANRRLCGFEALLRWRHPRRGLVSPAEFIPLAEETRLIVEIGAWVLRQACADLMRLPAAMRMAINLSPVQLSHGDIATTVEEMLGETGIDPARLELEITETALFTNDHRTMDTLQRLRARGVRIVLDDFGTGYSSLSHLRLYPLDKIKIDRSFVRDMAANPDSAAIVDAVVALARRLRMTTTAEGIEQPEQWEVARQAGCTEAQGFLIGEPKPIEHAIALAALPELSYLPIARATVFGRQVARRAD
ncbi:MAG TPA: EAL domain-containing protein [Xanthobacteraceae bacterium]|nr:EAL domain-containing protein [Xanthobacteraceae bacterium]